MPSEHPTQGYALSPQQRRLWRLAPGARSPVFRSEAAALWSGEIEVEALRGAIARVVARHEILRTGFKRLPGMDAPVQVVAERGRLALEIRPAAERLVDALANAPVPRVPRAVLSLTPLPSSEHLLDIRLPALCGDGATAVLLLREIEAEYRGEPRGDEEGVQYADVAALFNDLLVSEETEKGREHWAQHDPAEWNRIALPGVRRDAGVASFDPSHVRLGLPAGTPARVAELAARCGVEEASFWLACWAVFLTRLGDRRMVTLGIAFDGRTYEELEGALGAYERVLPLTLQVNGDQPLERLATAVGAIRSEAGTLQDYFGWEAFETSPGEPAPFLAAGFRFASLPAGDRGLRIVAQRACLEPFVVELAVTGNDGTAHDVTLGYDASRLDRDAAEALAERFRILLANGLENSGAATGDLDLFLPGERRRLVAESNRTRRDDAPQCLHRYFEGTADRHPERIAASFEDLELTYGELERRANRLARRLVRSQVRQGEPIGICLGRGLDMVTAILATLKAGAAWVPLEPSQPPERLRWMLADTGCRWVLGTGAFGAHLGETEVEILTLDSDATGRDAAGRDAAPDERPSIPARLDQTAYILYTSGSSGRPKGVVMSHRGIVNRLLWMRNTYPASSEDRVLFKTPFSFDASIWELFLPFFDGARLVVARPGGHRDASYLASAIRRREITVLQLVPSMFRVWLEESDAGRCSSLRRVFCGGEALPWDSVRRFSERLPAKLCNLYGPTEVAIDATSHLCADPGRRLPASIVSESTAPESIVPIGRPLSNVETYVLDRRMQPVPAGVTGELQVGGAGLARGYLGRPGLTAERFLPDPFGGRPGARLYRTGDRVVQRPDGVLSFLGRVDHQVKIRGFRIELGEIEARLEEHPAVRQAAVAVRGDASGSDHLVAYVAHAAGPAPGSGELRAFLRERLPDVMIPAAFAVLGELPLLASGKVDRRALPDLEARGAPAAVAPRSPAEDILTAIWSDVLGVPGVGVEQDFFALGGHSLTAIQAVSRVREAFGIEIDVKTLFESSTVAQLALAIEKQRQQDPGSGMAWSRPPIRPVPRDGKPPLSLVQQQLWLFDQLQPESPAYNIAVALGLEGRLNVPALERSLDEIIRRHEVLRTRFRHEGATVWQEICPPRSVTLPCIDLGLLAGREGRTEARELAARVAKQPFDLTRGPLLRALLIRLGDARHALLLVIHHIVSDAWSMSVLTRELSALYEASCEGRPSPLPPLGIQYADFAGWQRAWLRGEVLKAQLDFWKRELADLPAPFRSGGGDLLGDKPRPAQQRFRGERRVVRLAVEVADGMREMCRSEGATLFMVSLAACQFLLAHYSGHDDLLVGSPIIVRNHVEVEGLIGCFANLLPMRADMSDNPSFRRHLGRVRRRTLDVHAHQEVSLERILDALDLERDLARNPLLQIGFALHEVSVEDLRLPDLSVTPDPFDIERSWVQFDLAMNVVLRADAIDVGMSFSTDLFEPSTVSSYLESYEELLRLVQEAPDARRSEVSERLAEAEAKRRRARREQLQTTRLQKFEKLRRPDGRSRPEPRRSILADPAEVDRSSGSPER